MNIFASSLILICIGFAMFYPILFLINSNQLNNKGSALSFIRLNYLIHVLAGFVGILLLWVLKINYPLQISVIVYILTALVVVLYHWKETLSKPYLFIFSIIFGFIVFYRSVDEIVEITPLWPGVLTGILSSCVLSIIVFVIVSKKFWNNDYSFAKIIVGKHINYLFAFIVIRIIWNYIILFYLSIETQYGDLLSSFRYFMQSNPINLLLMILLGAVVPAISYFILRKQVNSIDAQVSYLILLILLISIIVTDFLYKFFLLQYGIVL